MERLTTSDFRKLIPHLPLADIFLIEICDQKTKKWRKMVELLDRKFKTYCCNACNLLSISGAKTLVIHLEGKKHTGNVLTVAQFYHPVYTYGRKDWKLALGKPAKPEIVSAAVKKAQDILVGMPKATFVLAHDMAIEAKAQIDELDTKLIDIGDNPEKLTPKKPKIVFSALDIIKAVGKGKGKGAALSADAEKLKTKDVLQKKVSPPVVVATNQAAIEKDTSEEVAPNKDASDESAPNNDSSEKTVPNEESSDQPTDTTTTDALNPDDELPTNEETEAQEETPENSKPENEDKQGAEMQIDGEGKEDDDVIMILDDQEENNVVEIVDGSSEDGAKVVESVDGPAQEVKETVEANNVKPTSNDVDPKLNKKVNTLKRPQNNATNANEPPAKYQKPSFLSARAALEMIRKGVVNVKKVDKTQKVAPSRPSSSLIDTDKVNSLTTIPCQQDTDEILGLIGVEFVVKRLKKSNDINTTFECCLCLKAHNELGMQRHLMCYNHRLKYCEINYPACIKQIRKHLVNLSKDDAVRVWEIVLAKIAIGIETYHGRDLPLECSDSLFAKNRQEIIDKTHSLRHACENYGPAFTNLFSAEEIRKIIEDKEQRHIIPKVFYSFTTRPWDALYLRMKRQSKPYEAGDDAAKQVTMESPALSRRERAREHKMTRERRRSRSASQSRSRKLRSRSPRPQSDRRHRSNAISQPESHDVWQAYRRLFDRSKGELDQLYKNYRQSPESHPLYDEEWKKFWKVRKAQLVSQGIDHRTYNYQPDWVQFFKVRIEELHSIAVENLKVQSRQSLYLPMTNDMLDDMRYHIQSGPLAATTQPMARNGASTGTVGLTHQQAKKPTKQASSYQCLAPTEGKPTILAVLRLMTALEEHLGSLGPKIIDLLTKTLTLEKTNPLQVNAVILTPTNCTLIETAMEKLKGVLFAGLLEGPKVRAFNKVINDTEQLLMLAENERSSNTQPQMVPRPVEAQPMAVVHRSSGNSNNNNNMNQQSSGYNRSSVNSSGVDMGNLWQNLQNIRQKMSSDVNSSNNPNVDSNMRFANSSSFPVAQRNTMGTTNLDNNSYGMNAVSHNYNNNYTSNTNQNRNSGGGGGGADMDMGNTLNEGGGNMDFTRRYGQGGDVNWHKKNSTINSYSFGGSGGGGSSGTNFNSDNMDMNEGRGGAAKGMNNNFIRNQNWVSNTNSQMQNRMLSNPVNPNSGTGGNMNSSCPMPMQQRMNHMNSNQRGIGGGGNNANWRNN